jgi:hypothetical protein
LFAGVFGYQLYQERQKTTGIEISVGERGISKEVVRHFPSGPLDRAPTLKLLLQLKGEFAQHR